MVGLSKLLADHGFEEDRTLMFLRMSVFSFLAA
jgi:hypothetical protein